MIDDVIDHNGKDDTAQGAAGGHDTECEGSALEKPGAGTTHCRIED